MDTLSVTIKRPLLRFLVDYSPRPLKISSDMTPLSLFISIFLSLESRVKPSGVISWQKMLHLAVL